MSKVISNNIAVCLLYAGRLKDGLQVLETSITADTNNIQVLEYSTFRSMPLFA
jgi:hypothetical protein